MKGRTTSARSRVTRRALVLLGAAGLAVPVAASLEGSARAAFPGTNGRIICSGALATEIPTPTPQGQSRLELFSMNPDGSGQTRLMHNTFSDYSPRYSADGTRVAWVRETTNNVSPQIWTMNADGSDQTGPLTSQGSQSFMGDWSPDGTKLVFQSNRDGNFEVYVMNADGSNQVNLTNNATTGRNNDSQPAWSPDGTKIAFHSNRDGNSNIHVMDADGTNVVNLTADSPAQESAPRWSADGMRIAFQSNRDAFPRPSTEAPNFEIYRMNADGSDVKRLTFSDYTGGGTTSPFDVTGYDVFPAWSPDGTRIVFHSGRAPEYRDTGQAGVIGQWEVYTIDAELGEGAGGAGVTRLTNRPGNDERCDWQPIPRQVLTVRKAGDGSGTVVSAPAGIDCGTDCTEEFARDTEVTLAASPEDGSRFEGFTGGGCSGTAASCTVTMSEARTVTATFGIAPVVTVTPDPTPTPTPTPTTTPAPTTTATPYSLPRRAARLSVRVRPKRDTRKPFRFTVSGRLRYPSSVRKADACRGRVTVRFKAGKRTISTRRDRLDRSCRYEQRVTFKQPRRFNRRSRLRVWATFEGNKVLLPKKSKVISARVK
ncbi:MAG TPA: hypothetical protein VM266_17395 [Solirubrobacteraceae bacterium]|nr:hypothetical protein [Solirubrobacteraceae bacterium]